MAMSWSDPSGDQQDAVQPTLQPPDTHSNVKAPMQETRTSRSPITSNLANPTEIKDHESEEPSPIRSESQEEYQPRFEPIRGVINNNEETLAKTVSQMYGGLSEDERNQLHRLASSMHRSRSYPSTKEQPLERQDTLAGVNDDDPRLNPSRPEFDMYVWARAFMRAMDEGDIKSVRAGFTFQNLNVSGSGNAVNLQSDFASVFMVPFRLGEYINFGPKREKKILRNFNGVVKSGEMLIVLGRPGSGCSTLLKTISGELTGLNMNKDSVVHYNGKYTYFCGEKKTNHGSRNSAESNDQRIQGRGRLQPGGRQALSSPDSRRNPGVRSSSEDSSQ